MDQVNTPDNLKRAAILSRRRRALRGSAALGVLLRVAPVALVSLPMIPAAHAADVYSGASNGNWLDSAVWNTGVAPTTADDPTLIQSGSVTVASGQSAQGGRVDVIGGASVTVNGTLTTGFLSTIGLAPTSGIANVPAGTTVTSNGTGTMIIDGSGATWNAGTTGVRIGNGATGTLTVSNGNGGTLDMANGLLSVGLNANGNGTLNIGQGGSVENDAAAARVGYNGATGVINITNGGTLTTTNLNSVGLTDTGGAGNGTVNISGQGSNWTITAGTPGASGNLNVGSGTGSKGTLNVSAGGSLDTSGNTFVGYNGGAGTVVVTGSGSSWSDTGGLTLGYGTGSTGSVTIANGATLNTSASNTTIIGYNDGTSGAGTGSITVDGAGSVWNSGNSITVGGATSLTGLPPGGAGTLTVSNGGTLNAAGQGIYVATMQSSTGTVNVTSGGVVNAKDIAIGNGAGTGAATVDGQGSALNLSNNIVVGYQTGTATLSVTNGGSASAQNTIMIAQGGTGTTTVDGQGSKLSSAGTLYVTNGDNSTGILNISNGGAVSVTGQTYAGIGASSNATINVASGGQFTGTNIALGVDATSTAVLNVGTGGAAGAVNANVQMGGASSTINFNHSDTYTYGGVISDSTAGAPTTGSVNFTGSGTTTLTGVNTYTSATNVNAGELDIASGGSIANSSLATVNSGARLSGAGTAGNVMVASGGTIAPTGYNALTVKDITFASGSIYQVAVSAGGQSGSISANTATLQGGTVQLTPGSGNYAPGTKYTILNTSGGVTGQFAGLSGANFAFMNANLDYVNPNAVSLDLSRNSASFASVALTRNQFAVASAANNLPQSNQVYSALVQQNAAGAQQAFDALSGEAHASAQTALINNALVVGDTLNSRLSQAFDDTATIVPPGGGANSFAATDGDDVLNYAQGDKKAAKAAAPWPMATKAPVAVVPPIMYSTWAQGFGSWTNRDSDGNAAALKSSTGGILSGIDVTYMGMYRFGIAAGYSQSSIDVDARASSLTADSYHIAGYAGARQGAFGLQGGVVYTWNDLTSTRTILFPGFGQTVNGNYDAGTAQVFGELNYRFMVGQTWLEGFAGVNYINHQTDAFQETGGAAALNVASNEENVAFSTLGMRSQALLGQIDGITFVGRGTLGWRHAFGDTDPSILASFEGGQQFSVTGLPIATDAVLGEAALDINFRPNMTMGLAWSGQFGDHADENQVKGQFTYRW